MKHRKKLKRRRLYYGKPVPKSETIIVRKQPKIMLARNEFHNGEAVWQYELGEWICVRAADCLGFLLKRTSNDAKFELLRRNFTWEWR